MNLGGLRTTDLSGWVDRTILAVPLGATEQHGPHLPLDTDTTIAVELCRRLAARVPCVVIAPAIAYGSSGEHAAFPGTLSIGRAALELLIIELVRSADHFAGVILVNAHGGNLAPLRNAVRTLRGEGRTVLAWAPTGSAGDSHAGHTETSVLLHLRPADVDLDRAEPGDTRPLAMLMPRLVAGGVSAVSANGILGDPTTATAADGAVILNHWSEDLIAAARPLASAVGLEPRSSISQPIANPVRQY